MVLCMFIVFFYFFFFKQKTAYEMRISDWSSDVCSSDLLGFLSGLRADSGMVRHGAERAELAAEFELGDAPAALAWLREAEFDDGEECPLRRTLRADGGSRDWIKGRPATLAPQMGRASCMERVCQYV